MKQTSHSRRIVNKYFILLAGLLFFLVVVLNMGMVSAVFVDDGTTAQILYDCGIVNTTNAVYTMNTPISATSGNCLTISANNITIDCQGNTINYAPAFSTYAVYSSDFNFTNIKNCRFNEIFSGAQGAYTIYFVNSKNGTIINNTIATANSYHDHGIYLDSNSDFNIIINNTITAEGVYGYGVYLEDSSHNVLIENKVNSSLTSSYVLRGTTSAHYNNSIDPSNLAEGLPVNYTHNAENLVFNGVNFDELYGEVIFGWCKNITITNSNFSSDSLNLFNINNSLISNNIMNTTKGYGIHLSYYSSNNTISNNRIITSGGGSYIYGIYSIYGPRYNYFLNNTITTSTGNSYAIYFSTLVDNNYLSNNTIITSGTEGYGVYITASRYNRLDNNVINTLGRDSYAIYLFNTADSNVLSNNTIVTSGSDSYGLLLSGCSNVTITGNNINSTKSNSYVLTTNDPSSYNHTIDNTNFAEGKPVNYTYNAQNLVFDGVNFEQYGQVIFAWCRNITIKNSNFSSDSLNLFNSHNFTISNNTINTSTGYGVYLYSSSSFNTVSNNSITTDKTDHYGVYLFNANYNNVTNNGITTLENTSYGIYLAWGASNNTLKNNKITTLGSLNSYGVYIYRLSNFNICSNNTIATTGSSSHGIYLGPNNPDNNTFLNNNITTSGNGVGIYLFSGSNNSCINNTIIAQGTGNGIRLDAGNDNDFSGMVVFTNGSGAYPLMIRGEIYGFTFSDSILNSSKTQELILFLGLDGGVWNFTNVTRQNGNPITINWVTGVNGTLNMHWYLDTYVHSGINNLQGANVTSYDNMSNLAFSNLTGSDGRIGRKTLLEYTRNGTSGAFYTRYSPFNMSVTKTGGYTSYYNSSINLSNNVFMDIELAIPLSACGTLSVPAAYDINQSLYAPSICIIVNATNITVDCQGYQIIYSTFSKGYGVNSTNYNFTTIKNCKFITRNDYTIHSGGYAVYYMNSNSGTISNNTLNIQGSANVYDANGIYLSSSSNNTIINNSINNNPSGGGYGVSLDLDSNNNNIGSNIIVTNSSAGYGIYLSSSSNNILTNNKANTSATNSYVLEGANYSDYNNSIDNSNYAEGKPVNYTYDKENLVFDGIDFSSQYGQVIFGWCRNITITNSNFSRDSLNLFNTNTSTIANNKINTSTGYGIWLYSGSSLNNISNNIINVSGDALRGILYSSLYVSNNSNSLNNNTIVTFGESAPGIELSYSNNNSEIGNIITTSGRWSYGIYLSGSNNNNLNNIIATNYNQGAYGIYIVSGSNNNNINNTITTSPYSSNYGIYVLSGSGSNNNINNTINAGSGIYLEGSNNNINNIITLNNTNTQGSGIYLAGADNNNITNNLIRNLGYPGYGIYLVSSANSNNISNNIITNSGGSGYGIYLSSSSYNSPSNNTITTSGSFDWGIYLYSNSNNNNISANTIVTNGSYGYGIHLSNSLNNILKSNQVNTSQTNSYILSGTTSASYNNSIDLSNLAEGLPVNYTYNADSLVFDNFDFTPYGQVIFGWSRNITITNSNFSSDSLNLFGTNMSKISNNLINTGTGYGLTLFSNANKNILSDNIITTSGGSGYGIYLSSSSNSNNISDNTIATNGSYGYGIHLYDNSNNNNLYNNIINTSGIYGAGLALFLSSNNNNLSYNTIVTNGSSGYGIYLSDSTTNNLFSGLNVKTSGTTAYAIYFGSLDNRVNVSDSILNAYDSGVQELRVGSAASNVYVDLINVTRVDGRPINISWYYSSYGLLKMYWYLDTYVHAGANNITGANVTSYNNFSQLAFSEFTGSNGTVRKTMLEYTRQVSLYGSPFPAYHTDYNWYSPYNLTVNASGYAVYYNSSITMSNNVFMDIDLGCGCPVGSDWIVSLNCTMIDSICNMPSYKVICTSGSLTMSNYTIIADKVITPIGHGCLIMDNRSRVMIGS